MSTLHIIWPGLYKYYYMDNVNILMLCTCITLVSDVFTPPSRIISPTPLVLAMYHVCVFISLMSSGVLWRFGSLYR